MVDSTTPDALAALDGVGATSLWHAAADGLVLVDDDGVIVATNASLDELFGFEGGELIGRPIELLVPAEFRTGHTEQREGFQDSPEARPMAASRLLHALRADGSTFAVNVSLGRLELSGGSVTMAAVRDLSARVEAEREQAEAERRQTLAEDRERIASDLHDTVIQRLFALGLDLQALSGRAGDETVARRVSGAVDTIDDIISDIRGTIFGLRSSDEPAGLRQRLSAIVSQTESALGFAPEVSFSGPIDDLTHSELAETVEPVVREALTNAARHARASRVTLAVTYDADGIHIEVVDNGRGIGEDVARSGRANLADRATAHGGRFAVEALPAGGTRLAWWVPASVSA
ncbi:MAG: PAS domain S-box protein [Actinomycetota bacterium]